ncbi:MAG: NAD(P)/FAD-dependent oxidoreductase [Myxococcales bacterium]|nr:NAD(P)/FAD-dependent oxidoreductase [Myxococcales bacterium]
MTSPTAKSKARTRAPLPSAEVDVAIIGAGPGGLTAGAYLAQHGLKVALFDQHYVAGGCMTMFERGRGDERYRFDVGLHYIGDCGPDGEIPRLLKGVGLAIDYVEMNRDGFDTLVFPDFRFGIPAGLERYRQRLHEYFPKEKRGIDRYCRFLSEVNTIGRKVEAPGKKSRFGLLREIATSGRLLARYRNAPIGALLDSCTKDPKLKAVMLGQSGDYGLPPSKVSALLHAGLANHYFEGAYYPKGGGQVISDELADHIEKAGGSIHLRCGVERVLIENGKAVGVRTEAKKGEQHDIRAKVVLSNADLKQTLLGLVGPEHLPSEWITRTEGFEMGGAIFMTYLGIRGDLAEKGMTNTNYWCFDDYDTEAFYREVRAGGIIRPRGCYVTSTSFKDPDTPSHSPDGVTSVEIMALVPGKASDWGVDPALIDSGKYRKQPAYIDTKQRLEDDLVRRLDELFPGAGDDVVFRESATPVTHSRYTRASDGTGYGLAATPSQFLDKRPGYRGPIEGLYLCGASTRAGHGIVGAMKSGYSAAFRIAKDMGRPMAGY